MSQLESAAFLRAQAMAPPLPTTESFVQVQKRLEELKSMKQGWLGDNAGEPLNSSVATNAEDLIDKFLKTTPVPLILGLTEEGGLDIEWHTVRVYCVLEPNGNFIVDWREPDFNTKTFNDVQSTYNHLLSIFQ
jgi:hypothetical protein